MSRAAQAWKTEGLASMQRPGAAVRLFMAIVRAAERANRRFARLGNPCVYDNAAFPWVTKLEREWRSVREELEHVLARKAELPEVQEITPEAAGISRDAGWKIFPLVAYGVRSAPNIARCPRTWALVRCIPGMTTTMFSILEPGKRIPPHRGPYNGVLRLHLGLVVPGPRERLGLRVGDERRSWEEGRALVFDDAYEHEAWNDTDRVRVVLFVDFEKPLAFPASLLNRTLLRLAVFSPFVREAGEHLRRWERRFYGDASRSADRA